MKRLRGGQGRGLGGVVRLKVCFRFFFFFLRLFKSKYNKNKASIILSLEGFIHSKLIKGGLILPHI
jgi:hypothetical protein